MTPVLKHLGLALVFLLAAAAQAASEPPYGTWLTQDGESHIQFEQCGEAICGRIVWMREAYDEQGRPWTDRKNPDPGLRDRPLMGLPIFYDFAPAGYDDDGDEVWEGKVYNPRSGDVHDAYITVVEPMTLKVEGCGLAGLICRTQHWSKVDDSRGGAVSVLPPSRIN